MVYHNYDKQVVKNRPQHNNTATKVKFTKQTSAVMRAIIQQELFNITNAPEEGRNNRIWIYYLWHSIRLNIKLDRLFEIYRLYDIVSELCTCRFVTPQKLITQKFRAVVDNEARYESLAMKEELIKIGAYSITNSKWWNIWRDFISRSQEKVKREFVITNDGFPPSFYAFQCNWICRDKKIVGRYRLFIVHLVEFCI